MADTLDIRKDPFGRKKICRYLESIYSRHFCAFLIKIANYKKRRINSRRRCMTAAGKYPVPPLAF
jgi:hypothetical protein